MRRNKFLYFVYALVLLWASEGFAQVPAVKYSTHTGHLQVNESTGAGTPPPNITYVSPNIFTLNTAITTLSPVNTGGAVLPGNYGNVVTIGTTGFYGPDGVVTDNAGNLYVADGNFNVIHKITPDGTISTFAGDGHAGAVNGQGTAAEFNNPAALTIDAASNIYVADAKNNMIRMITPAGMVSTYAGTGQAGVTNGEKSQSTFFMPNGIAMDAAGNIYVSEESNDDVRLITAAGMVSVYAGPGGTEFLPEGITIDNAGNIYVADHGNIKVKKVTPQGVISTIAGDGTSGASNGDGTALSANFTNLFSVVADKQGNIYAGDMYSIRKITPDGKISTFAGTLGSQGLVDGPRQSAKFYSIFAMTFDKAGNLYIADKANNAVRKIVLNGYSIDKQLPPGLTFDQATGNISGTSTTVLPPTAYTITAHNSGGESSFTVTISVRPNSQPPDNPPAISYQSPQTYYVNQTITPLSPTSSGSDIPPFQFGQAITFSGAGNAGHADGGPTTASFTQPAGVATDASGNVYVADYLNNLIRKVSPDGSVVTIAGSGQGTFADGTGADASFSKPSSVVLDAAGNLYVADSFNHRIRKITPGGEVTTFAGSSMVGAADGNGAAASFNTPSGLAIDLAGNIYVADSGNNLIRKISVNGDVITFAGSGFPGSTNGNGIAASFNAPQNLTVDGDGNVYVTDSGNNLIRKINSTGDVTTYAGNGSAGSDNGPALSASFNKPYGIVVDAIGNLFVSDFGGNLIRMIDPAGNVITLAGDGLAGGLNNTGTAASFHSPKGLALDANRKLYIADSGNNEVRTLYTVGYRIDKPLPPGLNFDNATGVISGKPGQTSPLTTYTVTAYNIYGSATAKVDIDILDTQSITFAPIPGKTVCDADFDAGATSVFPVTYTSNDPAVATIVAGKVHIAGAGTTTITAADGHSTYPQTLIISAAVTPSVAITPVSTHDCSGSTVSFTAIAVNGGNAPHYQWKINGENAGTDDSHFSTTSLHDNDKVTCVLTSSEACTTGATVISNEATFKLDDPVNLSVVISTSVTGPVCAGTNMLFTALAQPSDVTLKYNWQVNGVDAGAYDRTFSSTNLNDGDVVTCIVTGTGKCVVNPLVASNAITIKLNPVNQCKIVIPNTFTPNGDGINDLWNITALLYYPDCSVTVFSRYGSVVYRSNGYAKPWDGTSGKNTLPTGVYYYVIDLKNGGKPMSGPVTLVR